MKLTQRILVFFCTVLLSLSVSATPPKTISYQGVLTNSSAVPVNGAVQMTFRLYNVSTGGSVLYADFYNSVTVTNGSFNVVIGGGAGGPIPLPFDVPYWLGVVVNADAEMSPRQPLSSSPYALRAMSVDGSGPAAFTTFAGVDAGNPASIGEDNAAFGHSTLRLVTSGAGNTAVGSQTLRANTTGSTNTAVGNFALSLNQAGNDNTGLGLGALSGLNGGSNNTAVGSRAGGNLTSGSNNVLIANTGVASESGTTRIGSSGTQTRAFVAGISGVTPAATGVLPVVIDNAGQLGSTTSIAGSLISGPIKAATAQFQTTVVGDGALPTSSSSQNTVFGADAMKNNAVGGANVAIGALALTTSTGNLNIGIGRAALANASGSSNVAIGDNAGSAIASGSHNINIDNDGMAGDSSTIRFGNSLFGPYRAFIQGISGITSSGGVAVFVNSAGQLGTLTSSARFKENIASMDDASDGLMRLNPVTFNYLDGQDDGQKLTQYGLIAEEVAKVYPDLVVKTPEGAAETVRYHFLTPMLLNEVQKQQRKLVEQSTELAEQKARVATLERELNAVKAMLGSRSRD